MSKRSGEAKRGRAEGQTEAQWLRPAVALAVAQWLRPAVALWFRAGAQWLLPAVALWLWLAVAQWLWPTVALWVWGRVGVRGALFWDRLLARLDSLHQAGGGALGHARPVDSGQDFL